MALEPGTKAPEFTGQTEGGKQLSLSDYKGKWVVLYFYPKDNTPGCTKEACSFRDNLSSLTDLGAEVIGVSPDTVESHDKFREKFDLNFHLVADPDKEILNAYDVIGEKNMFGKKKQGVIRSTYIIDPEGNISYTYKSVKVDGHTEQVMNRLQKLQENA